MDKKKIHFFKIQADEYLVIRDDINVILNTLDDLNEDGIYPVTISRMYNNTDSYYEIHSDIIYILKEGNFLVFLSNPTGFGIQLDSTYKTVNVGNRASYMLWYISELDDKLSYRGMICTKKGVMLDVFSINEPKYIDDTEFWKDNYSSDIDGFLLDNYTLMKSAAEYRDIQLSNKLKQIQGMMASGEMDDRIIENPFEDLLYDEGYYAEKELFRDQTQSNSN